MSNSEIRSFYQLLVEKQKQVRSILGRPQTLAEKILYAHLDSGVSDLKGVIRGKSSVKVRPDRVAMQDATAQMAMLQFISAGRVKAAVPSSIHCDHLIRAKEGAERDLLKALDENVEVYDFLASSANKYGIDFWKPGSGIIHQVILENYALPGTMMIGTDSHTPNAGGLAMLAVGVGGADAAEVMAGLPWSLTWPKLIGVRLTGSLSGWTAPKDLILKVAGILTVKGGTGKIVEYFGPGVRSMSCTGRATVTNMGAELGATTSIFPFDERSAAYLRATGRKEAADLAEGLIPYLSPDPEVDAEPSKYFDELIEIDLSALEPHVVGPHTPDLARPLSKLKEEVGEKGYQDNITVALIGSCTNSSYEDIGRAAHIAEQATKKGLKAKIPFMITPGSEAVFETVKRDGFLDKLTKVGGLVLANACGPCIGQWERTDITPGQSNTIVTSFNRNFKKRNDGNAETMAFIASPEVVTAYALSGSLSFDPVRDPLMDQTGGAFKLEAPTCAELPPAGFVAAKSGFQPPSTRPEEVALEVNPNSERLALLEPFQPWDGRDLESLVVLVKALGKCTTDHISPAGPWLRYRGHLDRISDNMFSGAVNAFTGESGRGTNVLSGGVDTFSKIARSYKQAGVSWVAVGDENYGEGSSREHAAMSPRYLGCKAVIAKSFARIAETNLKKQGVLALVFENGADYDAILQDDRLSILGLKEFGPARPLTLLVKHRDGTFLKTTLRHSFSDEEIEWFKAGSALNTMSRCRK